MKAKKKILVAPLDWGLGHATRCIPVIHALLHEDAEVLIAADGIVESLLKKEFPGLSFVKLKSYNINYSSSINFTFNIFLQTPKIFRNIIQEHFHLKKIIREHKIDVVISDNRFGLWNKNIRSVFITHQIMIKCPAALKFWEPVLFRINKFFISKYDECWIPDYEGEGNLSGDLSHKYLLRDKSFFIGPLSRFSISPSGDFKYDLTAIISGPEPQRSLFEKIIIEQLKSSNIKALIILGKPHEQRDEMIAENIRIVSHYNSREMQDVIADSKIILCRSGYTSIMDLAAMRKEAILIPTPGQTEQEYLAEYLHSKKIFYSQSQKEFNLQKALTETKNFSVNNFKANREENILEGRIKNLLRN